MTRAEEADARVAESSARTSEGDARAAEANQRIAEADARTSDANARAEAAEQRVADADARASSMEARIRELEARARDAEARAGEADARAKDADARAADAAARGSDAAERSTDADARIAEAEDRASAAVAESERLAAMLDAAKKTVQGMQAAVESRLEAIEAKRARTTKALEEAEARADAAIRERDELAARLDAANEGAPAAQADAGLTERLLVATERIRVLELQLFERDRGPKDRDVDLAAMLETPPPAPSEQAGQRAKRYEFPARTKIQIDRQPGVLVDLSVTGAQVICATSPEVGRIVTVSLLSDEAPCFCQGRLLWARREQSAKGRPFRYRVGLVFTDIDEAALEKFIEHHALPQT
jgi:predicted  nucleic acid-binding Zn-ribbon protein